MDQGYKSNLLLRNLVVFGDFLILNVLFYVWIQFHFGFGVSFLNVLNLSINSILVINFSMLVAQFFFSTVVHIHRSRPEHVLRQVTWLMLLFCAVSLSLAFSIEALGEVTKETFLFNFTLYLLILLSRYAEHQILKRYRSAGKNIRKVCFVGIEDAMLDIYKMMTSNSSTGYRVVACYSDNVVADMPDDIKINGTLEDFDKKLISSAQDIASVDEIYCSMPAFYGNTERIKRIVHFCDQNTIHFYFVPVFSKAFGYPLKTENFGDVAVFTNYEEPLMIPYNKLLKRTFDIIFSLSVLLMIMPLVPFIILMIKIQSPGPIIFKQERTGINGKNFYCYKFRSMHVNKDADKIQATKDDPRKFAFGNFMRKANIDELPQFINVLKGDMSIVGPRPHMLLHTEQYRKLIDKYMVRHFVKPGITGWAQTTGFRGETKELWQMEGRVRRDIWYIENWSIWLDLRIIFKTVKQIFIHDKNAY